MKHLLTLFLVALSAYVYAGRTPTSSTWSAYSTGGKIVPVTQSPGDVVTLPIPRPTDRIQCVAFLVEPLSEDLTGKTITVQLSIAEAGVPNYRSCYPSSCPAPPNFRLYFTTVPGPYSVKASNANPTAYWWADVSAVNMGAGSWVVSVPLFDADWSDSRGVDGLSDPTAFSMAAKNCQQIGFSFGGGCYFDVGLGLADTLGTSTLHVTSFTVQ